MQSLCLHVAQRLARRETINSHRPGDEKGLHALQREAVGGSHEACLSSNDLILIGASFRIRGRPFLPHLKTNYSTEADFLNISWLPKISPPFLFLVHMTQDVCLSTMSPRAHSRHSFPRCLLHCLQVLLSSSHGGPLLPLFDSPLSILLCSLPALLLPPPRCLLSDALSLSASLTTM